MLWFSSYLIVLEFSWKVKEKKNRRHYLLTGPRTSIWFLYNISKWIFRFQGHNYLGLPPYSIQINLCWMVYHTSNSTISSTGLSPHKNNFLININKHTEWLSTVRSWSSTNWMKQFRSKIDNYEMVVKKQYAIQIFA